MQLKKHLPNILTLLNLLCGSIAVIYTVNSNFLAASVFVFAGIFFDFFDGFAARLLNVKSELGLQLDSLADMVTSGVVPGIVMFKLLNLVLETNEITTNVWTDTMHWYGSNFAPLPFVGLLITLATAYRLAKFNLDEEQQGYFKGLPSPANALFILSLPLIIEFQNNDLINSIILTPEFLLTTTLLSAFMLNAPIKLFALKFKSFKFKENALKYLFLLLAFLALVVLKFAAIPVIIMLYILLSVLDTATTR